MFAAILVIGFLAYRSIRTDLDHYVMPRQLDPTQIEAISQYLKNYPAHNVAICIDPSDDEASDYANDLRSALSQGGWRINNDCPDVATDLRKKTNTSPSDPVTYQQLWGLYAAWSNPMSRQAGLRIDTKHPPQYDAEISKRGPDPKNPEAGDLLAEALMRGHIGRPGTSSTGMQAGTPGNEEIVTLTVGPRSRTYHPPMTMKIVPAE
jgi:hypothetical protein